MKKVTVKNLIGLFKKNGRTKIASTNNLKNPKKKSDESSENNYWTNCINAIKNTSKSNDVELLDEKIQGFSKKIIGNESKRIKDLFQRDIDIIESFKKFDVAHLKPKVDLDHHKNPKSKSTLNTKGLHIKKNPSHIPSFCKNNSEKIGELDLKPN